MLIKVKMHFGAPLHTLYEYMYMYINIYILYIMEQKKFLTCIIIKLSDPLNGNEDDCVLLPHQVYKDLGKAKIFFFII